MTVYFIGAGPGAADLITLRGQRLIERCPVCLYAGSLVPAEIVAAAPPGALVRDTAPMHLDDIVAAMADADALGQDVARVRSGDPSIYGAVAEQMRRLDALLAIEDPDDDTAPRCSCEHEGSCRYCATESIVAVTGGARREDFLR